MSTGTNQVAKKARPTDILSHWPKLIENFQYSPLDFYAKVEKALAKRQIPELNVSRVDWKEGGLLSARREYLRVQRERLVFDICGAPFGTGFFVSIWFGKKPFELGTVERCILAVGILAVLAVFAMRGSMFWFGIVVAAGIALVIRLGDQLDTFLIRTPVVGYLYERFFRKITYYRIDLTSMYQQAVHSAVTEVIDEITKPQGIQPLSEFDRRPIMADLFQRRGADGRH